MNRNRLCIIDETLREGMQYRGMVFSPDQAMAVLNFQERLGIDICQAGYPPAHESEQKKLAGLIASSINENFSIKVAAMGRACLSDAKILAETGTTNFHLHAHVAKKDWGSPVDQAFPNLGAVIDTIRTDCPQARISLAFLDIGRTDPKFLSKAAQYLIQELSLDILSLPDTSGIMGPNQVHDAIVPITRLARGSSTRIGVHCHNDLGMASANTVMGVVAGATVVEASVFGLGERNGLADLYTTARVLKDQGYAMDMRLDDVDTFRAYYQYIDALCREQTGEPLLTYNTPFFGNGVKTHVAGTHGGAGFGLGGEEKIFLNVLCGKRLVAQYLDQEQIPHDQATLKALTREIKKESARLHRSLEHNEIVSLAATNTHTGAFPMNAYIDEIIPLLKDLIEFKSTASRPAEINKCADFIETFVKKTGADYARIDNNNVPSILVTPKNKVTPVLLMAHFDVVEAEDSLFKAVEDRGNLYGRGSNDDKYAVAICLVLLKKWMATLERNHQGQDELPFGLLLTGDEETGGYDGAQYALKDIKAKFAITLDGGNPEKVVIKEKGILQLELTARGRAAHGARPWLGINAIDLLVDDLQKIRPLFMDKAEGHWHKTMNPGIIRGGNSVNQVCDKAWALLDIRYTENDDPDQIVADIDRLTVSTISIKEKEPLFTGGDSDYLDKLLSLIPLATTGNEHGASDARFLGDLNIPGVIWGARGNKTAHAKDEHVEIKSVLMVFETLDRFMALIHNGNC